MDIMFFGSYSEGMESGNEARELLNEGYLTFTDKSPENLKTEIPVIVSPFWSATPETVDKIGLPLRECGRRVITVVYNGVATPQNELLYPQIEVAKAEAILGLIDHKNLPKVDVVAHSEGAISALIAASIAPEKFNSLVLIDPAGFIGKDTLPKLAGRASLKVFSDMYRFLTDSSARETVGKLMWESGKLLITKSEQAIQEVSSISAVELEGLLKELHSKGVKIVIASGVDDQIFPMHRIQNSVDAGSVDGFISFKKGHDEVHLDKKYVKAIDEVLTNLEKK